MTVQLDPDGAASWQPSAVVVVGSAAGGGPSYCGCCDVLNFFESAESAGRYLADRPEVNGSWVSIPAAIEAGTASSPTLSAGTRLGARAKSSAG